MSSSKERTRRYRERLATPELIEDIHLNTNTLRRQGYSVSDGTGLIEPDRRHEYDRLIEWSYLGVPNRPLRYGHQHLAIIRIDTRDAKLVDAVVAGVDEPGALVGTCETGAVLILRVGPNYQLRSSAEEFVTRDGRAGLFTTDAQPLDVAALNWRDGRSPLNTHVVLLPPMYPSVSEAAFGALTTYLKANGGRLGPLELPEDPMVASIRRGRALIAAADAKAAEEQALADADAKAAEEKQQADAAKKARFREIQASLGNHLP